jgi:DNA-directed RNA polymerase delta subunit
VRFRRVADEAVVLRQDAGEVLALNEVGTQVLELIGEGLTVPAIVDRLLEEYEVARAELEADIAAFVQELLDSGVIEPVGGAEGG